MHQPSISSSQTAARYETFPLCQSQPTHVLTSSSRWRKLLTRQAMRCLSGRSFKPKSLLSSSHVHLPAMLTTLVYRTNQRPFPRRHQRLQQSRLRSMDLMLLRQSVIFSPFSYSPCPLADAYTLWAPRSFDRRLVCHHGEAGIVRVMRGWRRWRRSVLLLFSFGFRSLYTR